MNPKQQREVEILSRLEAGVLDTGTAGELLGVGMRQLRRLRARFRREGMAAVIHGNSGRSPANRTDPALLERILALAGPEGPYHDLNVCHLQDLLAQEEQIVIGRATLERWLKQAGLRKSAKTAPPVHRRRRLRRCAEGMLQQIDGSAFAAPATCETPSISEAALAWPSSWFRAPTRQNAGVSPGFLPSEDPAPRKPNTGLTAHSLDNTALSRPMPQSLLAPPDQRSLLEFLEQ